MLFKQMKSILLFILALILSISIKAQVNTVKKDTIYSDENNQIIDKRVFNFKSNSSLYYGIRFEYDTIVLKRLRFSYLFGKLEESNKNQLFKLLAKRNAVDTTKLIVIHYSDTLKSLKEFPEKPKIVLNSDSTSHRHVASYKQFIRTHKTCVNGFKHNKKANIYHFYGFNNGHPEKYKKYTWQKDHFKLIAKMFTDNYKRFHTVIMHPNGNFFGFNYRKKNNNIIYNDIVKDKNWDKHLAHFKQKLESLNSL